LITRKR